jgi:hypothetical protein
MTPLLEAVYAGTRMPPWKDSMEAMLMIFPRFLREILPAYGLAEKKQAFEVDVHDVVPVPLQIIH